MNNLDFDDDMTEAQKTSFVHRWGRQRRRGMGYYLLRSVALVMLFIGSMSLFKPLFRSDPFLAATWTQWAAEVQADSFFTVSIFAGLGIGLLTWYAFEELFRNFK